VSKHPILEERDYSYVTDGDAQPEGINQLGDKGVKYAKIDKHGQIIHAFGTHMHYLSSDPPNLSQFIYETLEPNRDDAVVIGGDMNTNLNTGRYAQMMDTFHVVEPTYGTFLNRPLQRGTSWRQNHFHPDNAGTGRPRNIDYLLASEDFKVPVVCYNQVQSYRLNSTDRDFWGIFDLGDHQPVYGRFEFPQIHIESNDTMVCEGETLRLEVSTTLSDYVVEWYKDGQLVVGEDMLDFEIAEATADAWGSYRCEVVYTYMADSSINSITDGHYNLHEFRGVVEGRLKRSFQVGPDPIQCGITTEVIDAQAMIVSIYPNPVQDLLFVEVGNEEALQLNVYDTQGSLLHYSSFNGMTSVSTSEWPAGIYHVELSANKHVIAKHQVAVVRGN